MPNYQAVRLIKAYRITTEKVAGIYGYISIFFKCPFRAVGKLPNDINLTMYHSDDLDHAKCRLRKGSNVIKSYNYER